MTFREFMQRYRKKRKRIEKSWDGVYFFLYTLCSFTERHLKKAYNAGYLEGLGEGLGEGFEKGWDECESVHKVIDKVKVIEVKNEN